jgi:hypothetical protein
MPKELIGINDISAAAIGSTVGVGASDITFTFRSSIVTLGDIDDNADSYNDVDTNGGESLPMWVEVVNNTGSNIDLGVDYYIDITADAVGYRLHFPEQVLVPSTVYTWYFDKQGIPFDDSNLTIPSVGINDVEGSLEVVDNTDENINNFLIAENLIGMINIAEDYIVREISGRIGAVSSSIFRDTGVLVLQTVGDLLNTVARGILWALKTSTSISWRRKI